MDAQVYTDFDVLSYDPESAVVTIKHDIFRDMRGTFQEIAKRKDKSRFPWLRDFSWVCQINRSSSAPNVFRGMHAQIGPACQSKLVECVKGYIIDVILDARPDSKTFGKTRLFELDSENGSQLFIPKGFLHGFISCAKNVKGQKITEDNIFQYLVGGSTYDKDMELSVSMCATLKRLRRDVGNQFMIDSLTDRVMQSEKDAENARSLDEFLSTVEQEYRMYNKLWYR